MQKDIMYFRVFLLKQRTSRETDLVVDKGHVRSYNEIYFNDDDVNY